MLEWRRRREPSTLMLLASPLIAIGLTMLIGMIVFTAMGYDGFHGLRVVIDVHSSPRLSSRFRSCLKAASASSMGAFHRIGSGCRTRTPPPWSM